MLTEICGYLRNWFCDDSDIIVGNIVVGDSEITVPYGVIQPGQYVRIVGSVFNDGVICYGKDELTNEEFDGAVWPMRGPKAVIKLAEDIEAWQAQYGKADSKAMSPFNSESFAGYSYSKSGGTVSADGSVATPNNWQGVFAARLSPWRKL